MYIMVEVSNIYIYIHMILLPQLVHKLKKIDLCKVNPTFNK